MPPEMQSISGGKAQQLEHFKVENTLKGMDCRAASPVAMTTHRHS
jgi:hypothetical protein